MDPTQIVHLFANPWTAVIGVLVAVVQTAPATWVPAPMRRWIGWLAVLACAPLALLLGHDVAVVLLSAAVGLSGSWLLVEIVEASQHRLRARAEEPPPLLPPPPQPKGHE